MSDKILKRKKCCKVEKFFDTLLNRLEGFYRILGTTMSTGVEHAECEFGGVIFSKTYVSSSSHCLMFESRFWCAGGCGQKEPSVFKTSRWQWQYSALSPFPDSPPSLLPAADFSQSDYGSELWLVHSVTFCGHARASTWALPLQAVVLRSSKSIP